MNGMLITATYYIEVFYLELDNDGNTHLKANMNFEIFFMRKC